MDLLKELQEYQNILFHSELGKEGREYLKKRNITPNTAKIWGMGFYPNNYESPNIFSKQLMGRIIIPVYNVYGKLISLGGRTIYDIKPKYTNYRFNNHRNLFGIYINYQNIYKKQYAIITEGQLDVITAWQNGLDTVVCSFGAHTHIEQIALLARYTNNIYIIYDADKAGQSGMNVLKKIDTIDINIKLISNIFPPNEDMDSWLQTHTSKEFEEILFSLNNPSNMLKSKLNKQINQDIF